MNVIPNSSFSFELHDVCRFVSLSIFGRVGMLFKYSRRTVENWKIKSNLWRKLEIQFNITKKKKRVKIWVQQLHFICSKRNFFFFFGKWLIFWKTNSFSCVWLWPWKWVIKHFLLFGLCGKSLMFYIIPKNYMKKKKFHSQKKKAK